MITAHVIVKDEPLLYYVIKSVYKDVEKILLWDTGTTNPICKESLYTALSLDTDKKIDFREFTLESTIGHDWSISNYTERIAQNQGRFGVHTLRQKQIDVTNTEYFLILDGDEVWYNGAINNIKESDLLKDQSWSCGFVPNIWYVDSEKVFKNDLYGRVFRTEKTVMDGSVFPHEMHIEKATRRPMQLGINSVAFDFIKPYAHFEKMLKPHRRPDPTHTFENPLNLPEVILENTYFIKEYKCN